MCDGDCNGDRDVHIDWEIAYGVNQMSQEAIKLARRAMVLLDLKSS